jgi:hypothetical protein
MKKIPELLSTFKKSLGEINVRFCAIDAALAEALEQATTAGTPERQLEAWAQKLKYHLHFDSVPNLREPLGKYAIVFLHQVMEAFYNDIDSYLKDRGDYKKIDPQGADPRPEGEDALRRLVRKIQLIESEVDRIPSYRDETRHVIETRETHLASTIGRIEILLADYYRLVRNAAVHADAMQPAKAHYMQFLSCDQEKERIARHYGYYPAQPQSISIDDMVLYSKVLQRVAQKLVIFARPDMQREIVPYLYNAFQVRYHKPGRLKNAIIGSLRTDYLVDNETACRYADEWLDSLAGRALPSQASIL